MKRPFFALWPDNEVRAWSAQQAWLLPNNTGRRVPPENFHITLVFLGNVDEQLIAAPADATEGTRIPRFRGGWRRR